MNLIGHVRQPTQLRLKQSCEQKKLSVPIFKQVGHCKLPALFSQSTPIHFRVATSAVILAHNGTVTGDLRNVYTEEKAKEGKRNWTEVSYPQKVIV